MSVGIKGRGLDVRGRPQVRRYRLRRLFTGQCKQFCPDDLLCVDSHLVYFSLAEADRHNCFDVLARGGRTCCWR